MIDNVLDYNLPLVINFIDFKAAFDSVNREYIWTTLEHYGLPETGWPQVMEFPEIMEKSWNFIWSGKSHGKLIIYEKVMESHGTFFLMCIFFFLVNFMFNHNTFLVGLSNFLVYIHLIIVYITSA